MTELRKLKVKTISQQIYDLEVDPNISIAELKRILLQTSQVPIDRQRLIYLGKALQDTQLLSEIIKEDGQTIHLMAVTQPQTNAAQQPNPPQQQQQQQQQHIQSVQIQIGQGMPPGFADMLGPFQNFFQQPPQQQPQAQFQQAPQQPQQQPQQRTQSQPQQQPANQTQHQRPALHEVSLQPGNLPVIQLPLQQIQQISREIDALLHPQAFFPGPPLPVVREGRNNITILGNYLHQACFVIQRALPLIQRTADLLTREPFQTVPEERHQTEHMSRMTANLLVQIQRILSVAPFFQNLQLGTQPGQHHIFLPQLPQRNQQQARQPQQNAPNPPPQTQQPQPQPQQPATQPQNQPQQNQQQQPQGQQQFPFPFNPQQLMQQFGGEVHSMQINLGEEDIQGLMVGNMDNLNQLPPFIQNLIQQTIPHGTQNPQPPQPQQPQQTQQAQQPQPPVQPPAQQGPADLLGNMFGGALGGGNGVNLMTMSISDLMMQNYHQQMEEGEAEILAIFADVKVGDVMGAYMSGNYGFIDPLQGEIRNKLHAQIEKAGGRIELCEKLANSFLSTFVAPDGHPSVIPGFEPRIVAQEVLLKHIKQMLLLVDKDFTNLPEKFSQALVAQVNRMIGEVAYELSEGMNNGIEDYRQIINANIKDLLTKTVGQEMAMMFSMMLGDMIWQYILKSYLKHKELLEQQQLLAQQSQDINEEDLLKLIDDAGQVLQNYQQPVFSAEYLKGEPSYKSFE